MCSDADDFGQSASEHMKGGEGSPAWQTVNAAGKIPQNLRVLRVLGGKISQNLNPPVSQIQPMV